MVLPGFEERPRLATPPGGYSCWKHALRPSPPLPAHPRRLSGYSVARNDLHRAGGGNSDRTPVTSTRAATGERRRGEVSTEVAEPIVYIIHRGDSRRCSGQWSRLFPTARTAVETDGSPEHVLDQYRDAFEVAIGTGSIRGSERLWGPRLDWRCSMRPTCCRTICSSRSSWIDRRRRSRLLMPGRIRRRSSSEYRTPSRTSRHVDRRAVPKTFEIGPERGHLFGNGGTDRLRHSSGRFLDSLRSLEMTRSGRGRQSPTNIGRFD